MSLWMDSIKRANSDLGRKEDYLIGRKMIPKDNSYIINITNPYGNKNLYGKVVTLVSMPFEQTHTRSSLGILKTNTFVKVKFNGEIYECLFYELWLI